MTTANVTTATAGKLRHVRWIAGGTGSGKSTVAALLARRHGAGVYSGDRAERDWLRRCAPERQPRLFGMRGQRPGDMWRGRDAADVFAGMASRHGEVTGFLVEDLLAQPPGRVVLADYFGILPRDLAPLLAWPQQAAFLVPAPAFRRAALSARYGDPARAQANWDGLDPAEVLEKRLARDALWDAEVTAQARDLGLPVLAIDGSRSPDDVAGELAGLFRLGGE